jgi:hypothetical protein
MPWTCSKQEYSNQSCPSTIPSLDERVENHDRQHAQQDTGKPLTKSRQTKDLDKGDVEVREKDI